MEKGIDRPRTFDDLVLLTTCNRVEAYAVTHARDWARDALRRVFALPHGPGFVYELEGLDAAAHLIRVASGLDSVAVGESQIADQVRHAPDARPNAWRSVGPLAELFAQAARTARVVRRLAGLDEEPASASLAAVRYIREAVPLSRPRITLLGAGKMARLAAEALRGTALITLVNRDPRETQAAARRLGARAASPDEFQEILAETDVLIAATSARKPLIARAALERLRQAGHGHPLWILDLGVPRNVDPAAGALEGVRIVTIDELAPWSGSPPEPGARARAERKIRIQAEAFLATLHPHATDPVVRLRRAAEDLRRDEVRRALARLPSATAAEREVLDRMADRLVGRLLHAPTRLARHLQAEGEGAAIEGLLESWNPAGGRE